MGQPTFQHVHGALLKMTSWNTPQTVRTDPPGSLKALLSAVAEAAPSNGRKSEVLPSSSRHPTMARSQKGGGGAQEELKKRLMELLRQPDNATCADCPERGRSGFWGFPRHMRALLDRHRTLLAYLSEERPRADNRLALA